MRKAGFIYLYSDILKQEIALSEKTGVVFCADKTTYSKEEVDILDTWNLRVDGRVHRVKKIIGGEIVGFVEKVEKTE
jgi:predicted HicB family RNase H-like nuclease